MDADKIKNFFIFHFEKMILVVVIGASGLLLYKGFELPNYLDTHQPSKLSEDATQVRNSIDEDHNDQIIPPRQPTFDIIAETKKRYDPVDPVPYKLPHLFIEEGNEGTIVRRQDPALSPPQMLLAQGVATAIVVRSPVEDYPLADLEPADPVEKVEAPKVRERKPRGRRAMMMGGDDMDMEMMMEDQSGMEMDMMMMDQSMSTAGATRKFDSKFDFGARTPDSPKTNNSPSQNSPGSSRVPPSSPTRKPTKHTRKRCRMPTASKLAAIHPSTTISRCNERT